MSERPQPTQDGRRLICEGSVETVAALHDLAKDIAAELSAGDLLMLTGDLGAGKTTFTRGLAETLGITETISSPTFILAREHRVPDRTTLIHMDAYRLKHASELDDLGLNFSDAITVAEWGKGLIESQFSSWLELELEVEELDFSAQDPETALAAALDVTAEAPRTFRLWAQGCRWQYLEPCQKP